MITWESFKTLVLDLARPESSWKVAHPLDATQDLPGLPGVTLPASLVRAKLEEILATVESCLKVEWPPAARFLAGRLALSHALDHIAGPHWRYLWREPAPFWALTQEEVIRLTYAGEENLCLFNLFVGPVQDFIQEARKVLDLWTGSFVVAKAAFQSMTPILERYGPDVVIFPYLHDTVMLEEWVRENFSDIPPANTPEKIKQLAAVPNRAMAVVPAGEVEVIGKEAQARVKDFFDFLGNEAWRVLPEGMRKSFDQKAWGAQITDHFEVYWTAVPLSQKDLASNYHDAAQAAQRFAKARKLTRSFPPWPGGDFREKCTLCGHREVMGKAAAGGDLRVFWRQQVEQPRSKLRPGERLCAVCLTKRYLKEQHLGVRKPQFDSTADLAVRGFRQDIKEDKYEDFLTAINMVAEITLEKSLGDLGEVPGEWLFPDNLEEERFIRSEGLADRKDLKDLKYLLKEARRALIELKLNPPKYYAVLALDGDEMGNWMSGEKPPPGFPLTLSRQGSISRTLSTLGREVMPHLMSGWSGVTVYSGGDDLLALGTVGGVLTVAQRLKQGFKEGDPPGGRVGLGPQASLSGGLVIAHYHDSLERVLEEARGALDHAKEVLNRDALSIVVRLSSGSAIRGGYKWEIPLPGMVGVPLTKFLSSMASWIKQDKGLSPRFFYRLGQEMPSFYSGASRLERDLFEDYLKWLLGRHLSKEASKVAAALLSPDNVREILLSLADSDTPGQRWPKAFEVGDNLTGLLKIALFLARIEAL